MDTDGAMVPSGRSSLSWRKEMNFESGLRIGVNLKMPELDCANNKNRLKFVKLKPAEVLLKKPVLEGKIGGMGSFSTNARRVIGK